jgi:ABC-type Zn uptake system ZnuABC Zn-binding protein ZnuA
VSALFAEPQYPQKTALVVAQETSVNLYTLDPVVTGPFEKDAYMTIMLENLEVLKKALK